MILKMNEEQFIQLKKEIDDMKMDMDIQCSSVAQHFFVSCEHYLEENLIEDMLQHIKEVCDELEDYCYDLESDIDESEDVSEIEELQDELENSTSVLNIFQCLDSFVEEMVIEIEDNLQYNI